MLGGSFAVPKNKKYALFAVDLLLFVTSPLISTPNIFKLLREFGLASGLQVNRSKLIALIISVPPSVIERLQEQLHLYFLSRSASSIPYLGVNLAPSF